MATARGDDVFGGPCRVGVVGRVNVVATRTIVTVIKTATADKVRPFTGRRRRAPEFTNDSEDPP